MEMPWWHGLKTEGELRVTHLCSNQWIKTTKKRVKENRDYIKNVADVLPLTATQNIPQRGQVSQESWRTGGTSCSYWNK